MKIPKTLKMLGYEWKIIVDKKREGGEYRWIDKTIIIGDKFGEKESVLIHELLEAIIMDLGYRFYGQEGSMEYEFHFNHSGFVRIHKRLFEVLKENKLI